METFMIFCYLLFMLSMQVFYHNYDNQLQDNLIYLVELIHTTRAQKQSQSHLPSICNPIS